MNTKKILRRIIIISLILIIGGVSFVVHTFCTTQEMRTSVLNSLLNFCPDSTIKMFENNAGLFTKLFGDDINIVLIEESNSSQDTNVHGITGGQKITTYNYDDYMNSITNGYEFGDDHDTQDDANQTEDAFQQ